MKLWLSEWKWKQYESTLGMKNEIIRYYSLLNEMDGMCALPKWINKWIIDSLGVKWKDCMCCITLPSTLWMKMKRLYVLCYSPFDSLNEMKWLNVLCYSSEEIWVESKPPAQNKDVNKVIDLLSNETGSTERYNRRLKKPQNLWFARLFYSQQVFH